MSFGLAMTIAGGLLTVFALWWLYFEHPLVESLRERNTFAFGYGHYFVFAGLAAVGAGLAATVLTVLLVAVGLAVPAAGTGTLLIGLLLLAAVVRAQIGGRTATRTSP